MQDPVAAVNKVADFTGVNIRLTQAMLQKCPTSTHTFEKVLDETVQEAKEILNEFSRAPMKSFTDF